MKNNVDKIDKILLDIAPEMSDVDEERRRRLINYSKLQVGFGQASIKHLAIAYLTAHTYTMGEKQGQPSNVTSRREGDLQISYAANASDDALNQTSYGQEFLRMKKMFIFSARNRFI